MKNYFKVIILISTVFISFALYSQEKETQAKSDVDKLKDANTSEINQIKDNARADMEKAKPEIKKSSEQPDIKKTELLDQVDNEGIKTIIGTKKFMAGGYGAPVFKITQLGNNDIAYFAGLRTGFIMNHYFSLGAAANILFNPLDRSRIGAYNYTGTNSVVNMGYGGLLLEYYIFPKSVVHISIGVLIGGGAIAFQDGNYWRNEKFNPNAAYGFFAVEPEINVFVNITRFFRIGVGATYRYVNGIKDANIKDATFSGFGGHLMLQFGWF
jgi:hypothetical protein